MEEIGNVVDDDRIPREIEECHYDITDDFLRSGERYINTWGLWKKDGFVQKHIPKSEHPIDLDFVLKDGSNLKIFFESGEWKSSGIDYDGNPFKLSPDQFGRFFRTDYYKGFEDGLRYVWDLNDDEYYDLYDQVVDKRVNMDFPVDSITEDGEYKHAGNYDAEKSKETNVAGVQQRSASGRRLITPSEFGIVKKDKARYYVWPESGKEFRWSQWNDKNNLLIRIKFYHADSVVGLTYTLKDEMDENRGILGYVLEQGGKTLTPIAWTNPIECEGFLRLSFIKKFLHNAMKRINRYIDIPTDVIYENINNKEKITKADIDAKKNKIKKNLVVLREARPDRFIYD